MNPVNTTQLELVAQLSQLNKQLESFVKGDADTTIATNGGLIKSIAGISRDLNQFRFVQKVIDHRLYSDMISDDTNIENGMLVRVWGNNGSNGIYRKNATLDYSKVSYSDLYDLRDFLPNPWNYAHITKDETEFDQDLDIMTYTMSAPAVGVLSERFEGSMLVSSSAAGNRGSYSVKFAVHLTVTPTGAVSDVSLIDVSAIDIDTGFSTVSLPQITIETNSTVMYHAFTLNISVPVKSNVIMPSKMDMKLYHIDASKYKLL